MGPPQARVLLVETSPTGMYCDLKKKKKLAIVNLSP